MSFSQEKSAATCRFPRRIETAATPLEKWAYFFRYASQLTPDEINGRLADAAFSEAAGVLEMIAQSPREREQYEARLKFERDQLWRIKAATDEGHAKGVAEGIEQGRAEGVAEGIERGEFSGRIRVLQGLLGLPESPLSELADLDVAQLTSQAARLQTQLRDRRSTPQPETSRSLNSGEAPGPFK